MSLNSLVSVVYKTLNSPFPQTYDFAIPFWAKNQIVCKLTKSDGTLVDLTQGTDYSVSDPGINGTISRITEWTGGVKLTIIRTVALKQETDFVNGAVIDADTIERSLDLLTAIVQQQNEKLDRTFTIRIDEEGGDFEFPSLEERKNSIIAFDSTGKRFVARLLSQFDADVQSAANNAQSASNSANAASASATSAATSATEAQGYVPVSKENIAISASSWVNNEVTISVTEIKANSNVLVSPASNITDINSFATYGIYGKSNANGTLTLGCVTHPIAEVKINILIWG